jgi:hypothetical protein
MKLRNEGVVDRWARVGLGALIMLSAPALESGVMMMQAVGALFIVSGIVGWCPLYTLLHIDTRHVKHG